MKHHHLLLRPVFLAALLCLFCACSRAGAPDNVILGDERPDVYLPLLEGKRVALFSNQSGIVGDRITGSRLADDIARNGITEENVLIPFLEPSVPGGKIEYGPHVLDELIARGVNVTAIFSPEHGFRGTADAGELVGSSVDAKTGVEILSLYENHNGRPSPEQMDKFDVLVVDIQDVGLRYYTYYITMLRLMDACAQFEKQVVVLDRPNPNGFYVDGALLDMKYKSGIGALPIATVHGMTLGELAQMIVGEGWLTDGIVCDLNVVPCLGYTHATKYPLIMPPSPNLKDMKSVYLYASTCYFEGTVATPGRGTQFPFEVYGHPDMTGYDFSFTPESIPGAKHPRYQDTECHGVDLRLRPLKKVWKEQINLSYVIDAYRNLGIGDPFFGTNNHFELLAGVRWVREMIEDGASASEIAARWAEDTESFKKQRTPYLLYPEK